MSASLSEQLPGDVGRVWPSVVVGAVCWAAIVTLVVVLA